MANLSWDGLHNYVNAQVKRGNCAKEAKRGKTSWNTYVHGQKLPPLELLLCVATHPRIPIAESEFRDSWYIDRADYQNQLLRTAEDDRIFGRLADSQAVAIIAFNELEHIADYNISKIALAKASIIYSLIGTHTSDGRHIDRYLGDRLHRVQPLFSTLNTEDKYDNYFYELGLLLPHFITYLKSQFDAARRGILSCISEMQDAQVRAWALRNLIVSTARSHFAGEASFDEYEKVKDLLDRHQTEPGLRIEDHARLLEGLARSQLILSRLPDVANLRFEQAIAYIEDAKRKIDLMKLSGLKPPSLVEIQIARTELEIYVNEAPIEVGIVKSLITNLIQSIPAGFDRYLRESQRLALATGDKEVIKFEYDLRSQISYPLLKA